MEELVSSNDCCARPCSATSIPDEKEGPSFIRWGRLCAGVVYDSVIIDHGEKSRTEEVRDAWQPVRGHSVPTASIRFL